MNNKFEALLKLLKTNVRLVFSISLAIFLFILFFEPFPLEAFDFNNRLLVVAGLGAIVFLFQMIIRGFFQWLSDDTNQNVVTFQFPLFLEGLLVMVLSSVAFAFYLRYVGQVEITFHIMFKVVIICFTPPAASRIYDLIDDLREQNSSLILQKRVSQKQLEKYEQDYLNKSIEFASEANTENLALPVSDVAFIRSADNYVEIVYHEGDGFNKKLLRNTLKNIEQQIKPYSHLVRCHRVCLVNIHYIEKLDKNAGSHWIIIKGCPEKIPVSRQYLLKIKELL